MIISTVYDGVKVFSLGFFAAGPFSEPSLGDFVKPAPKPTASKPSDLWAGKLDAGEEERVGEECAAKPAVKLVARVKPQPQQRREVQVVGPATPRLVAWLEKKGCEAVAGRGSKTVICTENDGLTFGEVVEDGKVLVYAGEGEPLMPTTPLLVNRKPCGKVHRIPGKWRQIAEGMHRFEEPRLEVEELAETRMPYGEMRIYPRAWGSEAHVDPWVKEVPEGEEVLGYLKHSLGDLLSEKYPDEWAEAKYALDEQWERHQRTGKKEDEPEGVLVPVVGVPIGYLKDGYLRNQLPIMYGELRQRVRHYVEATSSERPKLEEVWAEAGTYVGVPEVAEFERTPTGHWDSRNEFVSTGCVEGYMVRTQVDRELRQLLRCEDAYGVRLSPKKARALAEAAEKMHGSPVQWLNRVSKELPAGHDEYDDGRPIEGEVEYREGSQMDRLGDRDYQGDLESRVDELEEASELRNVEDDYEAFDLKDNVIAWQDEMNDLLQKGAESSYRGHLAANDPMQMWYGALRTVDRLDRIARRARVEGSDPVELREELNSTCLAVRQSRRFLAMAEQSELKTGTLKDVVEASRQAAAKMLKAVDAGEEQQAQRLAFVKEGLVARPELAVVVAAVEPALVASLREEDPGLWAMLPKKAQRRALLTTNPATGKRKAKAYRTLTAYLSSRRKDQAKHEARITEFVTEAIREGMRGVLGAK